MSVDISATITLIWPTTESVLSADSTVDYATQKLGAIARAKRQLYGPHTIPSNEADIPEVAAYWIADQACVYLIPLAKDYYMTNQNPSTAQKGLTITKYNKLDMLDRLMDELQESLAANKDEALLAVHSATYKPKRTPAVSTDGMLIDPRARAKARGVP